MAFVQEVQEDVTFVQFKHRHPQCCKKLDKLMSFYEASMSEGDTERGLAGAKKRPKRGTAVLKSYNSIVNVLSSRASKQHDKEEDHD